jgi:hypothetical protein
LIENFGLSFFHNIVGNEEVGKKILHFMWGVMDVSQGKHELLLGDHPCIYIGDIDAPELAIALPISPTKVFLAVRGNRVAKTLKKIGPSMLALRVNESTVNQANQRIYARDETPTRFIHNRATLRSISHQYHQQKPHLPRKTTTPSLPKWRAPV